VQSGRGRPEPHWTAAELEWTRKRIQKRHRLRVDFAAYLLINAFLVVVWASGGRGYFWPGWVMAGWGVLLLLDAWNLYDQEPITGDDLDHELRKEP
jgi:fatty acid desaturase